jgi:hypothetical protein
LFVPAIASGLQLWNLEVLNEGFAFVHQVFFYALPTP